jgi:hypothetical protein
MIIHSHIGCDCEPASIGAHFENALAAIDQPGTEFYVPYPTEQMSCDAIAANMQLLNNFIGVWNQRLRDAEHELIRSQTTIRNCQTIIQILSTKLGQYQVKQNVCDNPIVITPTVDTTMEGDSGGGDNAGGSSSSGILWLLLIGAGVYAYSRRKKKTRRATA